MEVINPSEEIETWIEASQKATSGESSAVEIIIQGLGRTHILLRKEETRNMAKIYPMLQTQHGVEALSLNQASFHIARYWVKDLFDIVSFLEKLETNRKKNRYTDYKKTINFLRQPLAKLEIQGKGRTNDQKIYHFPAPIYFQQPDERCYGWACLDKDKNQYNISRLWLAEEFLKIILN